MNESPSRTRDLGGEKAQGEVSLGWLLSPDELAHECAQMRQRPKLKSWAIGMELPNAVVQLLESELVPVGTRLALFASSNGPVYPVAVYQAGATQIRAMLSLSEPRTQEWLREAVGAGRMRLGINIPETAQFVVADGKCDERTLEEVEDAIQRSIQLEREEGLWDKLHLANQLLKPGTVPSGIPGFEVQKVRLVIVLADGDQLVKSTEPVPQGETVH